MPVTCSKFKISHRKFKTSQLILAQLLDSVCL